MNNLPNYYPGQIVLHDSKVDKITRAELGAMRGIETWMYFAAGTSFVEEAVTHILNGGFWLPVTAYNPPVEASRAIDTSLFDKMMEDDPDEQAWLKENIKPRKIEVTDYSPEEAQYGKKQ